MRVTCPTSLTLFDTITLEIFGEGYKLQTITGHYNLTSQRLCTATNKQTNKHRIILVIFEVLTAVLLFWVIMPCGLIALKMEALYLSETLVSTYESIRRYKPEQKHRQNYSDLSFHSRSTNEIKLLHIFLLVFTIMESHDKLCIYQIDRFMHKPYLAVWQRSSGRHGSLCVNKVS
jgi:hypothetical protein